MLFFRPASKSLKRTGEPQKIQISEYNISLNMANKCPKVFSINIGLQQKSFQDFGIFMQLCMSGSRNNPGNVTLSILYGIQYRAHFEISVPRSYPGNIT